IKYVHTYENKNDRDSMIVWAIGAYPVDHEDSEVEIVSFISTNPAERDPETEAVFKRDGFYSIGGKIIPAYYGDVKRPKELPWVIDNESAIFDVSVCDYVGKEIKFVVKIVFQHAISRFAHLKNTICPYDSLVFVVGQLEAASVVHYKLIATHHNVKNSKEDSDIKASSSRSSNDFEIDNQLSLSLDDNFSKKRVKIEDVDKLNNVSVDNEKFNFNLDEGNKDDDKMVKKDKRSKSSRSRKSRKGG
ncbi:23612_t:CDS:2, partial [Gigaspora rosea]